MSDTRTDGASALRPSAALLVALAAWALALAVVTLDRSLGPAQQRINVRWVDGATDVDRLRAEAALRLRDGEELERGTWVYRPADRSHTTIQQLVSHPLVADTAHVDRESLRVLIDAPGLPSWFRRLLEVDQAMGVASFLTLVGLFAIWRARRGLRHMCLRITMGPAGTASAGLAPRPHTNRLLPRTVVHTLLTVQDEWDWWAARAYFPLLGVLVAAMVLFNGWQGLELAQAWDPWTIGDWLVTYASGFVRRGLGGELVLAASRLLRVAPNLAAWGLFVSVFAAFAMAFASLLRARRLTFWLFVLCLSPAALVFTFHNPDTVGRKDSLLFLAATLWALWTPRGSTVARATAFAVVAFALTLTHELVFFFTPYFMLIAYLQTFKQRSPGHWWSSALVPLGSAIALFIVGVMSGPLSDPALCARIIAAGAPVSVCDGVLSFGRESLTGNAAEFLGVVDTQAMRALGLATVATLLPPAFVLLISSETVATGYRAMLSLLAVVLFSAPLFVLAVDWGRWLAIHAMLATIACATLLPAHGPHPARPPFSWRAPLSLALGLVILVAMTSWSIEYCCRATLLVRFAPLEAVAAVWDRVGP